MALNLPPEGTPEDQPEAPPAESMSGPTTQVTHKIETQGALSGVTRIKPQVAVFGVLLVATLMGVVYFALMSRNAPTVRTAAGGGPLNVTAAGSEGADKVEHELQAQRQDKLSRAGRPSPAPISTPPLAVAVRKDVLSNNGMRGGGSGRPYESSVSRQPTAEERYREAMYKEYLAALGSDTAASSKHSSATRPDASSHRLVDAAYQQDAGASNNPLKDEISSLLASRQGTGGFGGSTGLMSPGGSGEGPVGGEQYAAQNAQAQKVHFTSSEGVDTLMTTRERPISPYEIRAGWDIPAVLEGKLGSDLPGNIRALVRENVYDTATGKYLLIPQGARLLGIYNSQIVYGQSRVQVVWTRLIFPDGSAVNLGKMPGVDAQGMAGFHDQVNEHFLRLISEALLASAFAAGIEISQKQPTSVLATPSTSQLASAAVGQQMSEMGAQMTNRNLNIQPTLVIRPGYKFNVHVTKDIVFSSPYSAL